ncbi:hypothetical protein ACH4F6_24575 [Streptomyces sp. NPDC017936]|uniref:hypothetical protein n=1 Tax=Streptomyces sp. NPDC017936 TaxID=3365016 RepID=UPI0037B28272
MKPTRIRATVVSAALVTVLATASGGAQARTGAEDAPRPPASGAPPATNACLTPDGTDLNALLSIREPIIGPPACRVAPAGEKWVRSFPGWVTAPGAEGAVYPAGYTPSLPEPTDDFVLKFLGARIVQDIGTPRERSVSFGPEVLRLVVVSGGLPVATFATPPLRPLKPGHHTSTVFVRLSARHCDGLGTDPEANCLPGGETQYTAATPFEVVERKR